MQDERFPALTAQAGQVDFSTLWGWNFPKNRLLDRVGPGKSMATALLDNFLLQLDQMFTTRVALGVGVARVRKLALDVGEYIESMPRRW